MEVQAGDQIEVMSVKVDTPPRRGTVAEVISREPAQLRVSWDDGSETVLYPRGGMVRVVAKR